MDRTTSYVRKWSHRRSSSDGVPMVYMGDAELNQPYTGAVVEDMKNPFPEAVLVEPVLSGRRRLGVFEKIDDSNDEFYAPIEASEGRHRYDAEFEWEPQEEQRLVRKIDWRICSWVCLMFAALQLDRGNIVQALSDDFLTDLGLTSNDFNYGQVIYYTTFFAAELPSQLVSKRIGPDNWIPFQMVAWSIVASFQAFISGRSSFFVCRFLLGALEGGFIPDTILYLSYWYMSSELPKRLSVFWAAFQATNIISAFLAFGILRIHADGRPGWSWLFALEGTLTGLVGIASYFYLPPSPYQTASKVRGTGWFSEHEEKIMANRILRDDPGKGDMHNRQGLSWSAFKASITDYHLWPLYLLGFSWNMPSVPVQNYITLNLVELGFDTFTTNLLTIPAFVLFIVTLLVLTFCSERVNERFLLASVAQFWMIPWLAALLGLPPSRSPWTSYALGVMAYGMPYANAILTSLTSRNAGSVRTRTVATALHNMGVQAATVIGINIYRTYDSPLYYHGNAALLSIACYNIVLMVAAKLFYMRINRKRDDIWNTMSKEQKEDYLATTTDQGNKRLDFRFAH